MRITKINLIIAAMFFAVILCGCKNPPRDREKLNTYSSFREVPGVTHGEIAAIESVQKQNRPFVYDAAGISGEWMRKTYNYRSKPASAQIPWLAGVSVLLLAILILLFVSFQRKRGDKKRLERQVRSRTEELNNQYLLMSVINKASALLLNSDATAYLDTMVRTMEMLGNCTGADRLYIWQNVYAQDGKLHYRQICKWMRESFPANPALLEFAYADSLPGWEDVLSAGRTINSLLDDLDAREKTFLSRYSVQSVLAIPLFLKDEFWGFASFDNCHRERVFSGAEEHILRSWGLLAAGAIERGEIAIQMIAAVSAARTASESKTKFLANMSHEMRTPLNAIIGISELELGSNNLAGEAFDNMEKIYSGGVTLLGIINDILDISKIESGKFVLIPVVYDIASMINDTINLNIVRIGSKPIQFRLHIDGSLPAELRGDELRVKQIFNNLLSNAFKYTDSGYVDWTLVCAREGDRVKLTSTIADTGRGMSAEDLEKLFKETYFQTDQRANYHVEGTGLGLPITGNLIKLMDGNVSVQSTKGSGSVFTVEFYQEASGEKTIGDDAAKHLSEFRYTVRRRTQHQKLVRADMSYATVLVVDDVITNLEVSRGMIKPYGIKVDCVISGEEAVKRIREEKIKYDAIFMDHMMPGIDGIEAARIIREEIDSEYAKNIPIIALTANAILGNDAIFLEKGFQAFLSKPIDIFRLDNVLNQWVRDKVKEKNLPASPVSKEDAASRGEGIFSGAFIPGLNIAEGLARLENDEESYLTVLRAYAAHTPAFIKTAKENADNSFQAFRIAVHGIKGSSRGIGAAGLGDTAEKLENAAKSEDKTFIASGTGTFIETAEKLVENLKNFLEKIDSRRNQNKPEKEAPDPALLAAISDACADYDISALRNALEALDAYRYPTLPGLADWLKEQMDSSNFEEIRVRLAEEFKT